MKTQDLRKKTQKEIMEMVRTQKVELNKLSIDLVKGKEKNVKKLGVMKKDIARMLTVLNEMNFVKETQ
jgi:ribosomal protein L29